MISRRKTLVPDLHPNWMRYLMQLPFVGVAIFDAKSKAWIQFNDRFCAITGYSRRELARLNWRDICHPREHALCDVAFRRLVSRRSQHVHMVRHLMRKDGAPVRAELDLSFARAPASSERFIIALVNEIHAREAAERDASYEMVFSEGGTAVVVLDAGSWDVVDANPAAQRFYGWTLEQMKRLGLHVWDVSLADREKVQARLQQAAKGVITRVEGIHRIATGEPRDVEIYCGPVSIAGRRCVYGIVHDVTERKRAEVARLDAEAQLRAVVEQSIIGIYIIEEGRLSFVNARMAEIFGYAPEELVGMSVGGLIAEEDRGRVLENVRRRIDGEVGNLQYDFRGLRKDGLFIDVGVHGSVATIRGKRVIVGVIQDVTEQRNAQRQLHEYVRKLELGMLGTVDSVSRMTDLRDPYTGGHERRVADLSAAIGRELGLEEHRIRGLQIAGRIHDIGKIGVPAEILSKPTRLSAAEYAIVKLHSEHGHQILKGVEFPWPVAEAAYQHHERMDGSGYPRGLKGDEIIVEARILAVADVIEAMASHRPYRASLGLDPALQEIKRGAARTYDADVATAAVRLFRDGRYEIPG